MEMVVPGLTAVYVQAVSEVSKQVVFERYFHEGIFGSAFPTRLLAKQADEIECAGEAVRGV